MNGAAAIDPTPDEIRANIKTHLEAKRLGLPAWPNSGYGESIDPQLYARRQTVETYLKNLDTYAERVKSDESLSAKGKSAKFELHRQEALREIEQRGDLSGPEREQARLQREMNAKIRQAENDPGRLAQARQTVSWFTGLSKQERIEAWKLARTHGDEDFEFVESLALAPKTIRKTLLPWVTESQIAEIKDNFAKRYAPDEFESLNLLTQEIDTIRQTVDAALKRVRTKAL